MNLYDKIEQAIRQHLELLHVADDVRESDLRHAIRWVMRDNPEIFWFVHQYHFDKDDGIVSLRYRCSPERCAIIQESIDDIVVNDFQINYVRTLTQLLDNGNRCLSRVSYTASGRKNNERSGS